MFPLQTKNFPESASELEARLNAGLDRILIMRAQPVRVIDQEYPALQEIAINLDQAELRSVPPRPASAKSVTSPALQVSLLQLSGQGMSLGPARVNLTMNAREVRFNQSKDADDNIVLGLEAAASGKVEISVNQTDLETSIREVASREAGKHGVKIEEVKLTLTPLGPRAFQTEVNLRAVKLFFAATIRISGKAEIDDQLTASLSNLRCAGEGTLGSLACGFLSPQLQKVEGRSFPLAAVSLGEIRLRDVQLEIGPQIKVTAIC